MSEAYTREELRPIVGKILHTIGWHKVTTESLDILVDILQRYVRKLAKLTYQLSENSGCNKPQLEDAIQAYRMIGTPLCDMSEYLREIDPIKCPGQIPRFPVQKKNNIVSQKLEIEHRRLAKRQRIRKRMGQAFIGQKSKDCFEQPAPAESLTRPRQMGTLPTSKIPKISQKERKY